MIKTCLVFIARLITGANARWVGCSPSTQQRVYFANHTSTLDSLVIWASLPPNVRTNLRPIAAKDYWEKSKVRRYLATQVFNAKLIERKKPTVKDNPLVDMIEALGTSHSILIFPEGTRQSSGEMSPFRGGLFHLAKARPDIDFIPVLVENLNRILPKGEFLPVPLIGNISFGAAIKLLPGETKPEFLQRAQDSVKQLMHH